MELVTGTGDVVRVDAESDADLLRVARVGVGALGIVTEVTLQCVPAFLLHARETIEPLDDVLERLVDEAAAVDHFELYWMPGGGKRCQVKRNARTDEPARPQSRLGYVRDKWLGENLGLGVICKVGRRFPRATPTIAKLVTGAAAERDVVDRSDRVFCTPRRVHFVEMEYGLPVEHLADAVRELRAATRTLPTPILFPIEVRVSAADDIPLSTGFGRPSGWIAVHQYRGAPYEEYFDLVERIMDGFGGRPHWGKLHGQRAATLAPRYPQWADFQAARDKLDPDRTFANPYLERVLGSIATRSSPCSMPRPVGRSRRRTARWRCCPPIHGGGRRSSPSPATPTSWPTSIPPRSRPPVPTASVAPRTPTCNASSPGRVGRSAPSTRCSSDAPKPGPCSLVATTSTTIPASAGHATTATTSRSSATTPGSS